MTSVSDITLERLTRHAVSPPSRSGRMNPAYESHAGPWAPAWLEDLQLVAKDHYLDVAIQMIGGASDKLNNAAQQQVREREEHVTELPTRMRPDATNALAEVAIAGSVPFRHSSLDLPVLKTERPESGDSSSPVGGIHPIPELARLPGRHKISDRIATSGSPGNRRTGPWRSTSRTINMLRRSATTSRSSCLLSSCIMGRGMLGSVS